MVPGLNARLDRIEALLVLDNDASNELTSLDPGKRWYSFNSTDETRAPGLIDGTLICLLEGKLEEAQSALSNSYLDFGGVDDVPSRRVSGPFINNAWRRASSGSGNYMWRYQRASGQSWLLPETASGCHEIYSFKLKAALAVPKLLNEIAWIEAGRPDFKSTENPDGWDHTSHEA